MQPTVADEIRRRLEVPAPSSDLLTRQRHRMTFRNERNLYRRTSSLSGKPLISIYAPDSRHTIYAVDEWWSDKWDGQTFGRPIDFTRPFFPQFHELALLVPRIALFNVNPHNSDYCQQAYNNKNCYLCTVIKDSEDSMYISHSNRVRDSFDCDYVQNVELCYDCLDSERLYSCTGCQHCQNSNDLYFSIDCIGCRNCIGCSGLRNQEYCIQNEQVSRESFEAALRDLKLNERQSYERMRSQLLANAARQHGRTLYNINVEDCSGANLIQAKNCTECYDSFAIEECAYCTWIFESHHCADVYGMGTSEWVYESVGVEKLNFGAFNTFVSDSGFAFYSDLCFYCTDIFGCVGLRRARNGILNRSYSREEYEALRSRLIAHMRETGEWGSFFPAALSPFAYNESVAHERFPLTAAEAAGAGYRWRAEDRRDYRSAEAVVPDNSQQAEVDLCSKLLACRVTGKNFKITPQELRFAQKMSRPLPDCCPDERYRQRLARRGTHQ